jgi:ankyrin repeat protein
MPVGSTDFSTLGQAPPSVKGKTPANSGIRLAGTKPQASIRFSGNDVLETSQNKEKKTKEKESFWKRTWHVLTAPFRWVGSFFKWIGSGFKSKKKDDPKKDQQPKIKPAGEAKKSPETPAAVKSDGASLKPSDSKPRSAPVEASNASDSDDNLETPPAPQNPAAVKSDGASLKPSDSKPKSAPVEANDVCDSANDSDNKLETPPAPENPVVKRPNTGKPKEIGATEKARQDALYQAIIFSDLEAVQKLIAQGVDVNMALSADDPRSALMIACIHGDPKVIKALLEAKNLDINRVAQGWGTALHTAARPLPKPEIIQLLLDKGADVKACDRWKNTALHRMLERYTRLTPEEKKQTAASLQLLLAAPGINVNAQNNRGETPAHRAAKYAQRSKDSTLFDVLKSVKGIDLNIKDDDGVTPLDMLRST